MTHMEERVDQTLETNRQHDFKPAAGAVLFPASVRAS